MQDTQLNTDYIAGFFDGEGSVMLHVFKRTSQGNPRFIIRPSITITQIDENIIKQIQLALGYGRIVKKRRVKGEIGKECWHDCYALVIERIDHLWLFVREFKPLCHANKKLEQLSILESVLPYFYKRGMRPSNFNDHEYQIERRKGLLEAVKSMRKLNPYKKQKYSIEQLYKMFLIQ